MKRIRKKLNSRQGASLLFAILVFMICILAGTAALTAAASNVGRYRHLEADQQKYLSVSSAVDLMQDEFSSHVFQATLTLVETKTWWWTEEKDASGETKMVRHDKTEYSFEDEDYQWYLDEVKDDNKLEHDDSNAAKGTLLTHLLNKYVKGLFLYDIVPSYWYNRDNINAPGSTDDLRVQNPGLNPRTLAQEERQLTITGDDDIADKLNTVKGSLSVTDGGCNVTIVFSEGDDDSNTYQTTVYLPADDSRKTSVETKTTGDGNEGQTVIKTKLTWTMAWPDTDVVVVRGDLGGAVK